uniref:Uncharacterized protein n=1 Tax=Rhizophora mucronata TaxID=61149 RepID=A0A2P2NYE4_RHIMU
MHVTGKVQLSSHFKITKLNYYTIIRPQLWWKLHVMLIFLF